MNIQEYDIMNEIAESGYENQRILTEKTGYSLGKVNQSLNELIQKEYLTKEYQLTEKAEAELWNPNDADESGSAKGVNRG